MADYDLSRLSNRSFEQLVQSVAVGVLGPGIVVFGDGPDGGREATFERQVPYPSRLDAWDGYGVVQAKSRQRPANTKTEGTWAVNQLKQELDKYSGPDSNRRTPDYFIYATNVVLTPVRDTGSKDKVRDLLEDFKNHSGLKDYAIWDYDQLRTVLDRDDATRRAYAAFITPSDVLATILSELSSNRPDIYDALTIYLEKELLSDECVNLEQAGHSLDERIPLATVFVDLPTHSDSALPRAYAFEDVSSDTHDAGPSTQARQGFIKTILAASSERLDPASLGGSVLSDRVDSGAPHESRGRFVLIGGPGQGKTTLTQFMCQIFRAAIISEKPAYKLSLATSPNSSRVGGLGG